MLEILRRIVQEVGSVADLDEALAIIVRRVKEAMFLDACSVYLREGDSGEYVLRATEGLNPEAVGRVRLGRDQGLVALVGEREEPLNLEDAQDHPRYYRIPGTGEERYRAFLAVPIIHYRRVLAVLVARHSERRLFDSDEVSFLVTIGAQLAAVLAGVIAEAGWALPGNGYQGRCQQGNCSIQGIKGAPGAAIGTIALSSPLADLASVPDRVIDDTRAEELAFRAAVAVVEDELRATGERMAMVLPGELQGVFEAYAMFLGDEWLVSDTLNRIRAGSWAPGALREVVFEHARLFDQMEDPYLRARAEDIRAIGHRLLSQLQSDAC
jgi:phosphotransferase system enzyme I (PtsP)